MSERKNKAPWLSQQERDARVSALKAELREYAYLYGKECLYWLFESVKDACEED